MAGCEYVKQAKEMVRLPQRNHGSFINQQQIITKIENKITSRRGTGSPLPDKTRRHMESGSVPTSAGCGGT